MTKTKKSSAQALTPFLVTALDGESNIVDNTDAHIDRLLEQSLAHHSEPLPEQVAEYVQAALAASSRKKYQSDLKRFLSWGGIIPAQPDLVARYIAAHGHTHAPATIQRWLVAIGKAHSTQGLSNPCKTELVHLTYRGIRRTRQKQSNSTHSPLTTASQNDQRSSRKRGPTGAFRGQVKALEVTDLKKIILNLGDSPKDYRDRALLLVGFMGARRRSELVAMTLGDLQLFDEGLIIQIPYSKTDQEGKGEEIEIAYAVDSRFCPIHALYYWIEHYVEPLYDGPAPSNTPIFRSVNRYGTVSKKALTDRSVARIIKANCFAIGLSIDDFSGHSLRAGFATAAAKNDKPSWQIRKQTLHKSDVMLNRYIRDGQRFKNNPGDGML